MHSLVLCPIILFNMLIARCVDRVLIARRSRFVVSRIKFGQAKMRLVASVQQNYTRERFCSTLTLLDLLTAIGLYMSTCDKITRTKSHVYLELSAKRSSVRTHINMHARKNSRTFIFVC